MFSVRSRAPDAGRHVLQIDCLEGLLGAMKQNSKIVPVYAKVLTDSVFIAFFQEYLPQEAPIALRQFFQNLPDS